MTCMSTNHSRCLDLHVMNGLLVHDLLSNISLHFLLSFVFSNLYTNMIYYGLSNSYHKVIFSDLLLQFSLLYFTHSLLSYLSLEQVSANLSVHLISMLFLLMLLLLEPKQEITLFFVLRSI